MAREQRPIDPYAAPHAPKDKSGPVVRIGIIAVLLGGAALGWSYFSDQSTSADLTPPAAVQEQAALEQPVQVADATPQAAPANPSTAPEAAPAAREPASAPAPAPRRQAAPAPAPTNVPPPSTTIAPASPAPVGQM